MDNFQGWDLGLMKNQGHTASITTLALEGHQLAFPNVLYVHNFPGAVESGIGRGSIGFLMRFLKTVFALLARWSIFRWKKQASGICSCAPARDFQ